MSALGISILNCEHFGRNRNRYKQGTTAEEIAHRYPALNLADVYATIAFYLNHQQMVEDYLAERQAQSKNIQQLNEARLDPNGIRDRLLSRKHAQEAC